MKTALIINGKETSDFARGQFNDGLFNTIKETLKSDYDIIETVIEDGYDVAEEIAKFKKADLVIYQHPVFWFSFPSSLKKYVDEVYAYGEFFGFTDGPYGSGGMMKGKQVMFSTTWNSPADEFDNPDSFMGGLSIDQALLPMVKTHEFCAFDILPAHGSFNVIHDPQFDRDNQSLIEHLKTHVLSQKTKAT